MNQVMTYIRVSDFETKYFLYLAALFGLLFIIITPPFQAPDEPQHYFRSYQLANLDLFADKIGDRYGFKVPSELEIFYKKSTAPSNPYASGSFENVSSVLGDRNYNNKSVVYFDNTAIYPPIAYIPTIASIVIGKLLTLPHVIVFYLSRLCNLMVYIACIFFAIRIIPFGKKIMFCLGLMPMALYLAGTSSPDSTIIGLGFLTTALVTKIFMSRQTLRPNKLGYSAVACITLLALTKNYLFPVILLLPMISQKIFAKKSDKQIFLVIMAVSVFVAFTFWNLKVLSVAENIHLVLKPGENISSQGQLHNIIQSPLRFILVLLNTLLLKSGTLLTMGFIGIFGWLDIALPFIGYILFVCILTLSILYESTSKSAIKLISVFANKFLLVLLSSTLLMFVSLYIGYSPVGSSFVDGLQGRYFIPLAPLAIPFLVRKKKSLRMSEEKIQKILLIGTSALLSLSVFAILNANYFRINY